MTSNYEATVSDQCFNEWFGSGVVMGTANELLISSQTRGECLQRGNGGQFCNSDFPRRTDTAVDEYIQRTRADQPL